MTDCARRFGDLALLRLGPRRVWLASHPDLIEQVLLEQSRTSSSTSPCASIRSCWATAS